MQRLLPFLLLLSGAFCVSAQLSLPCSDGRLMALGGGNAALYDGSAWCCNPAGLSGIGRPLVSLSYQQQLWQREMGTKSLGAAIPDFKAGAIGIDYTHFGNLDYHQQKVSLAQGLAIVERYLALGVALHYFSIGTSDPHYDSQRTMSFSLGLLSRPSDKLSLGLNIFNPNPLLLPKLSRDWLSCHLNLGATYSLSPDLLALAEIEKELSRPTRLRVGLEYNYSHTFFGRIGMATRPTIYTFGMGYWHKSCTINLALQIHQILGTTPHVSMSYRF